MGAGGGAFPTPPSIRRTPTGLLVRTPPLLALFIAVDDDAAAVEGPDEDEIRGPAPEAFAFDFEFEGDAASEGRRRGEVEGEGGGALRSAARARVSGELEPGPVEDFPGMPGAPAPARRREDGRAWRDARCESSLRSRSRRRLRPTTSCSRGIGAIGPGWGGKVEEAAQEGEWGRGARRESEGGAEDIL